MGKDQDNGFFTLIPKKKQIGKFKIKPNVGPQWDDNKSDKHHKATHSLYLADGANLAIEHSEKSWQHKAWRDIKHDIEWDEKPAFKGDKSVSKKMRHIVRIAFSMKVRGIKYKYTRKGTKQDKKFSLDTTANVPSANGLGYMIGDSKCEIMNILNTIGEMCCTRIDEYRKKASMYKCDEIRWYYRAFVIYDDMSYDAYSGDILGLLKDLSLKYNNKGEVTFKP